MSRLPRDSGRRLALLALAAMALPGCAADNHWLRDRALDATDILDVKYGWALGVGAKVEATLYLGVGLGFAALGPDMHEYYGRVRIDHRIGGDFPGDGRFLHLVLFGVDGFGMAHGGSAESGSWNILCVNLTAVAELPGDHTFSGMSPPGIDHFRFGGEVIPGFADLGLYLNVGEFVDFLAGLASYDPADDDGMPKGPREPRTPPAPSAPAAPLTQWRDRDS